MENASSDDEVRPRLTTFFYSVAATVIDAVLLYFVFVLQGGPIDASGTLITIISAGLLFPCVAGIFVSIFWERKDIFVYAMMLYGLIIFAGSVYYISLLSSLDIWGVLFAAIGLVVMYAAIRHVKKSHPE